METLTSEEIRNIIDIIDEVADCTQIVNGEFMIVESWNDVEAIEKATKLTINKVVEIVVGNSDNWGFSDEYTTCHECGGLIRTSPDSYSWTPNYAIVNDCELLCGECIKTNPEGYLQDLINNPNKANTILDDVQLEELGFKKLEDEYENGFYDQYDNPHEIYEKLKEKFNNVIFSITNQEQFRTNFICWVRNEE